MKRETYKALQKIFGRSEDLFAQETVEDIHRCSHLNTGSHQEKLLPFGHQADQVRAERTEKSKIRISKSSENTLKWSMQTKVI